MIPWELPLGGESDLLHRESPNIIEISSVTVLTIACDMLLQQSLLSFGPSQVLTHSSCFVLSILSSFLLQMLPLKLLLTLIFIHLSPIYADLLPMSHRFTLRFAFDGSLYEHTSHLQPCTELIYFCVLLILNVISFYSFCCSHFCRQFCTREKWILDPVWPLLSFENKSIKAALQVFP